MARKMPPKVTEKMPEKLPKKWALFHEKSLYAFICPVEKFFDDFGGHFGPRKGVPWGVDACDEKNCVKCQKNAPHWTKNLSYSTPVSRVEV